MDRIWRVANNDVQIENIVEDESRKDKKCLVQNEDIRMEENTK